MAEVINIVPHIKKREEDNLEKVKEELQIELERLNFDIEKELNRYVIFDTSGYYELSKEENNDMSKENAMKYLTIAFDIMTKLNEENAANDISNIITRLENNSY